MIAKTQVSNFALGSCVSILCVVYQSLYRAVPVNGDLLLGLPIGKEFAHPGLYSHYDLLISSGIRGPFHLYKYLGGLLYGINIPADIVWHAFFLTFLFLTFLALWYLSLELTTAQATSALILALVAVAHPLRGSLHASAVPILSFVTASAAIPLALAAIVALLRKRYFLSMATSSFVFNIHPYVGLLSTLAIAAAILMRSGGSLSKRAAIILGGGALALPNGVYILTHLPSNFAAAGFDFYAQFRLYAMHAFVEDHWREGYGWFFMNLAGAIWFSRFVEAWKRGTVWALMACWFLLMAGYVFNSYVTKNEAVLLMFLFRATYFIKPIIFVFVVHGMLQWRSELNDHSGAWWKPLEFSSAVVFLFLSAILPMEYAVLADVLALIAYGFMTSLAARQSGSSHLLPLVLLGLGVALLCLLIGTGISGSALSKECIENGVVGVVVASALLLIFLTVRHNGFVRRTTQPAEHPISAPRLITMVLAVLLSHHLIIATKDRHFPFVPDVAGMRNRILIHDPQIASAGLMHWARSSTPQQSLFVVPPDEEPEFNSFRLVAERGVFVTIGEINQLAFGALVYHEAHLRLLRLGVRIPSHRKYETVGYYALTLQNLRALARQDHADYIVFDGNLVNKEFSTLQIAYRDEHYVVFNLHDLIGT